MSKNISELSARQGLENNLFETLSRSDTANDDNKKKIAQEFLIGKSSVTGTISFYDFLKDENKNKKVYICNGTACLCAQTQDSLNSQLLNHFKPEEIGHMTCLGRCHENAAFHINGNNYSGSDILQIEKLLSEKESIIHDKYNIDSIGDKILTNTPLNTSDFSKTIESMMAMKKSELLDELKQSSLRGRGGAGFPISFKLESAAKTQASEKYIICNADEGDPGAYSDRYLLEQQPYLVLYGMAVSARIVGATNAVLYIRAEYPGSIAIIQTAIDEINHHKICAEINFKVISAQGAYICGEETALINSIEGQRPEVRTRPPFPTQQGLFNKPTVVNNVETLASIYSIISNGGKNYQFLGTNKSSGTKLVSLDSFFNKPGVYEVEMGTPLNIIFEKLGGGFKQKIKAFHIGGPLGGVVPFDKYQELNLDFESFSNNGFLLGHASVVCIPDHFPMINYLQHLFEFAAYESCGKCFPCRLGTKRGEELLNNAINTSQKIDHQLFDDLLDTLHQGSLCAHGGGIPLPVRNILHYFDDEIKEYFS